METFPTDGPADALGRAAEHHVEFGKRDARFTVHSEDWLLRRRQSWARALVRDTLRVSSLFSGGLARLEFPEGTRDARSLPFRHHPHGLLTSLPPCLLPPLSHASLTSLPPFLFPSLVPSLPEQQRFTRARSALSCRTLPSSPPPPFSVDLGPIWEADSR